MHSNHEIERAARAAHEVNRAYCLANGDQSQVPWEDAPSWQRESAIAGVRAISDNPFTTPAESHAGWMRQKLAEGWTFGPYKDPGKKQHPCMVPYHELEPQQRVKDSLFGLVVRSMLGFICEAVLVADIPADEARGWLHST